MANVLDTIKRAMDASGRTRYALSRETGIAQSVLSRLVSGERGVSIDTAERLADVLGLEIIVRPRRTARKGG
jgi:plasmid maintenance system antidote protein VapI